MIYYVRVDGDAAGRASALNSSASKRNPSIVTTNNVASRIKPLCIQTKTSWNETAVQEVLTRLPSEVISIQVSG